MTIKSSLNIVALLSVATVTVLFAFLFYTTWQINKELDQIEKVNQFSKRASDLNIVTEQFLAYKEPHYYEKWNMLYEDLQEKKNSIKEFPTGKSFSNALPSLKQSFKLIEEISNNPGLYQYEPKNRELLIERATARIRSGIQLLLSGSHRLEQARIQRVRDLQVYQRFQFLLILIPGIGYVVYMIFRIRKRILDSLGKLIESLTYIASGNIDTKIAEYGFEEFDELAKAFDNMTKKLKDHIREEQKSLKEKSVLLQEVHHRVKNNLAVISGMMQLQVMESENEELNSKLGDSLFRIKSMAQIHELLYETESFSSLNFSEQTRRLVNTISKNLQPNNSVAIDFQFEDIYLNVNQAIPCSLVINELVTNCFKHAFKDNKDGTITIRMSAEQQIMTLIVLDSGPGLPASFDIHQTSTFGMLIIQTLCSQLDAKIEYQKKSGSQFKVHFEIKEINGVGSARLK
jgi:two-component sensor histidine kinase